MYQFKPVLKFLGSPDQRLLIADEVGLGKTIEAGIIMNELQARTGLGRVLVLAPAALCPKWRDEMRSKFEEEFELLEAGDLRDFLRDYREHEGRTRLHGIASLELARRTEFITQLGEDRVHFDLAIIDEAHHCRNPGPRSNELASVISEDSDALLLLTATPLHLGNQDLFHILNLVAPGEFSDLGLFEERVAPNQHVNEAGRRLREGQYREAVEALQRLRGPRWRDHYEGNIHLERVLSLLEKPPFRGRRPSSVSATCWN